MRILLHLWLLTLDAPCIRRLSRLSHLPNRIATRIPHLFHISQSHAQVLTPWLDGKHVVFGMCICVYPDHARILFRYAQWNFTAVPL